MYLYHFISTKHLNFILKNNFCLKFVPPDCNEQLLLKDRYISTTRKFNLNWCSDLRLVFNQNKLKRDFRIKPIHYFNIINKSLNNNNFDNVYDLRDVSNIELKNKKYLNNHAKNEYDIQLNQFEERIIFNGRDNISLSKYLVKIDTIKKVIYDRYDFTFKEMGIDFKHVEKYEK